MKILILNWRDPKNPKSGGAEKVTLEYAKAWKQYGWEVIWLAGGFENSKRHELIDGISVFRYGNSYTIYLLAPYLYWTKFRDHADLIIDQIHGLPFFTPIWAPRVKKIAYIHEVAQDIWDEMFSFPLNTIGKFIEKNYFLFYKKIQFLTVSESTKKDLENFGVLPENITILPNGLSMKIINKPVQKNQQLTLLYVSRLVKMKGIENVLEIFSFVQKQIPDSKLLIVGDGEASYVAELKIKAKELGVFSHITFLGYIDDLIELYQKSHFLLHTSVREGFGLVIMEANSQGTPVFVYNSPGLRDAVKNGVNGYIFEKSENKKIAEKIIDLYKNKAEYTRIAQTGIEYTRQFTWKTVTEKSISYIKNEYAKK